MTCWDAMTEWWDQRTYFFYQPRGVTSSWQVYTVYYQSACQLHQLSLERNALISVLLLTERRTVALGQ